MAVLVELAGRPLEALDNPYVGPRPFRAGEPFFAREREALELFDLLIAERIVMLHSPSGAGKSSLIQAALIPRLRAQRFNVLPTIRVGRPMDAADSAPGGPPAGRSANRFLLSTLLSLGGEAGLAEPSAVLVDTYLDRRPRPDDARLADVLVFDQFEEVLTVDALDLAPKTAFFEQLGALLDNPRRWALFALREDYLAALDPYLGLVPTRLQATFRLDFLDQWGAREAIERPALKAKRPRRFTKGAVDKLVEDLRGVRVQLPDGSATTRPGPYVEPVQLQVVCRRLWAELPAEVDEIAEQDVSAAGDVNEALRSYYAERVGAAATEADADELDVRRWIDRHLITPQGIRSQVLHGSDAAGELPPRAIGSLIDAHLVRAENRGNRTWYELAHDRLIQPVRDDNAAWFGRNLSDFERAAERWEMNDRLAALLLRGESLAAAERWVDEGHAADLSDTESAFLWHSRQADLAARRQRRNRLIIRGLLIVVAILSVFSWIAYFDARRHAQIAASLGLAAAAVDNLDRDPELSILLALEAASANATTRVEDILHRAVQSSRAQLKLAGHRGAVLGVAVSRDGQRIATAGADRTARLWEAASGRELLTLVGHAGSVNGVAFSPDGRLLATASTDRTLKVWDTASGQELFTLGGDDGHTGWVNGVAFNSDGQLLASAGQDGTVRVWSVPRGRGLHVLGGHGAAVNGVAFGKEPAQLASVGDDRTVRLWDAVRGQPTRTLTYTAELQGVAISPDGFLLAVASRDRSAGIWGILPTSSEVPRRISGHTDWVYGVAFSPDGTRLATAGRDWKVKTWDLASFRPVETLLGHTHWVNGVTWAPDGQRLITASQDGAARVWDTGLAREVQSLSGHTAWIAGIAYSPDGSRLATASTDGRALVWEADSGRRLLTLASPGPTAAERSLQAVAFSPDGARLATSGRDGKPRLWDAGSGGMLREFAGHCDQANCSESNQVVFSPDGTRLATAARDFSAAVWDIASGREALRLQHKNWVYSVAFSPDGTRLATASWDETTKLWDAASGQELRTLKHESAVNDVAFSPDGAGLATSTLDGQVHLWDVASGNHLRVLTGPADRVYSLAFNADGTRLATASWDRTVRVWDLASGEEVLALEQLEEVYDVAFRPGTKHLAAVGAERLVHVYTLDIEELKSLARGRVTRDFTDDECEKFLKRARCR